MLGAQGMFSHNRVADWVGITHGGTTAEGDPMVLASTVGRIIANDPLLSTLDETPPGDSADGRLLTLVARRTQRLARAVKLAIRGAGSAQAGRLACQQYAIALAESHAVYRTLGLLDPENPLTAIFALDHLQQHAAWFVGEGLLTAERAGGLQRQIDEHIRRAHPMEVFAQFDEPLAGTPLLHV